MGQESDLTATAQEIDALLRAVRQKLHEPIENDIARGGLTGPQVNLLQVLVRNDGMNLRDLRQAVGLAHSTVSGIVDRLEQRGIVVRRADGEDGRMIRVYVSKAVKDYIRKDLPFVQINPLMRALQKLDPQARRKILESLRHLRQALEEN